MPIAQHTPEIRIAGAKLTRNCRAPGGAPDLGRGPAKKNVAPQIPAGPRCGASGGASQVVPCPVPRPRPRTLLGGARPHFRAPAPGVVRCRARKFRPAPHEANTSSFSSSILFFSFSISFVCSYPMSPVSNSTDSFSVPPVPGLIFGLRRAVACVRADTTHPPASCHHLYSFCRVLARGYRSLDPLLLRHRIISCSPLIRCSRVLFQSRPEVPVVP